MPLFVTMFDREYIIAFPCIWLPRTRWRQLLGQAGAFLAEAEIGDVPWLLN